jgi:hypothetical protein
VSCGLPAPRPAEPFRLRRVTPREVPRWYHVYCTEADPATGAGTFAQGWGDTRFAPLQQADGMPVHTYYAASTPECAWLESVLHDVPLAPPGLIEIDRLRHFHLATLRLAALDCVSFHSLDLPPLQHLSRAQLVDSLPTCYAETRAWAQAAFDQRPQAHGIAYGSRRHDAARCLLLFGQRLPTACLAVVADEPLASGPRRQQFLELVRSLDIHEV